MLKHKLFSLSDVPCRLLLFVGLLSLFYKESPKLGMCKGKHRHCAVRLKIFGVSTWQPGTRLGPSILRKGCGSHTSRVSIPSTVLVAVEYLDLYIPFFNATSYQSMLITQKIDHSHISHKTRMCITISMFPILFQRYILSMVKAWKRG